MTKAIEINPQSASAYYNRGVFKDNLEDYQGAIADYTKAIEIDPDDASAYTNRGNSKELVNDRKGACDDWRKSENLGGISAIVLVETKC